MYLNPVLVYVQVKILVHFSKLTTCRDKNYGNFSFTVSNLIIIENYNAWAINMILSCPSIWWDMSRHVESTYLAVTFLQIWWQVFHRFLHKMAEFKMINLLYFPFRIPRPSNPILHWCLLPHLVQICSEENFVKAWDQSAEPTTSLPRSVDIWGAKNYI